MASATAFLGFEEIETGEQVEKAVAYCQRSSEKLAEDLRDGGLGWSYGHGRDRSRELHRILVAIERYWS